MSATRNSLRERLFVPSREHASTFGGSRVRRSALTPHQSVGGDHPTMARSVPCKAYLCNLALVQRLPAQEQGGNNLPVLKPTAE